MKPLVIILSAMFLALQYKLWLADGSILQVMNLQKQLVSQQISNKLAYQYNAILEAEVAELKKGTQAVEERARSELGMVKQGEEFYQFVD